MGLKVVGEDVVDGGGHVGVGTFASATTGSTHSAGVHVGLQDGGMDCVWHRAVFPRPMLSRTQEP